MMPALPSIPSLLMSPVRSTSGSSSHDENLCGSPEVLPLSLLRSPTTPLSSKTQHQNTTSSRNDEQSVHLNPLLKKVFSIVENNRRMLEEVLGKLQHNSLNIQQEQQGATQDWPSLPVNFKEDLEALETFISCKDSGRQEMIQQFSKIGGKMLFGLPGALQHICFQINLQRGAIGKVEDRRLLFQTLQLWMSFEQMDSSFQPLKASADISSQSDLYNPPGTLKFTFTHSQDSRKFERYSPSFDASDSDEEILVKEKPALLSSSGHSSNLPFTKPLLGKLQAKKRLLAFSGKSFSSINKLSGSSESKDDKLLKKKKKKKDERVSVIEQIKDEEEKIKEAFGLKNLTIDPFERGIVSSFHYIDSPDSIKKMQEKSKLLKLNLAKVEADISERHRLKEEYKNRKKERAKYKYYERDSPKKSSDEKTKILSGIPKNWTDLKNGDYSLKDLRKLGKRYNKHLKSSSHENDKSSKTFIESTTKIWTKYSIVTSSPFLLNSVKLDYNNGKEIRGSFMRFTKARPSIIYCINSDRYSNYYASRRELVNNEPYENIELIHKLFKTDKLRYNENSLRHSDIHSHNIEGRSWFPKIWGCNKESSISSAPYSPLEVKVQSKWDSDAEENVKNVVEVLLKNDESIPESIEKAENLSSVSFDNQENQDKFLDGLNNEYEAFLECVGDSCSSNTKNTSSATVAIDKSTKEEFMDMPENKALEGIDSSPKRKTLCKKVKKAKKEKKKMKKMKKALKKERRIAKQQKKVVKMDYCVKEKVYFEDSKESNLSEQRDCVVTVAEITPELNTSKLEEPDIVTLDTALEAAAIHQSLEKDIENQSDVEVCNFEDDDRLSSSPMSIACSSSPSPSSPGVPGSEILDIPLPPTSHEKTESANYQFPKNFVFPLPGLSDIYFSHSNEVKNENYNLTVGNNNIDSTVKQSIVTDSVPKPVPAPVSSKNTILLGSFPQGSNLFAEVDNADFILDRPNMILTESCDDFDVKTNENKYSTDRLSKESAKIGSWKNIVTEVEAHDTDNAALEQKTNFIADASSIVISKKENKGVVFRLGLKKPIISTSLKNAPLPGFSQEDDTEEVIPQRKCLKSVDIHSHKIASKDSKKSKKDEKDLNLNETSSHKEKCKEVESKKASKVSGHKGGDDKRKGSKRKDERHSRRSCEELKEMSYRHGDSSNLERTGKDSIMYANQSKNKRKKMDEFIKKKLEMSKHDLENLKQEECADFVTQDLLDISNTCQYNNANEGNVTDKCISEKRIKQLGMAEKDKHKSVDNNISCNLSKCLKSIVVLPVAQSERTIENLSSNEPCFKIDLEGSSAKHSEELCENEQERGSIAAKNSNYHSSHDELKSEIISQSKSLSKSPIQCLSPKTFQESISKQTLKDASEKLFTEKYSKISPIKSLTKGKSEMPSYGNKSPLRSRSPRKSPVRSRSPIKSPMRGRPKKSPVRDRSPMKSPLRSKSPMKSPVSSQSSRRSPVGSISPRRSPVRKKSPVRSRSPRKSSSRSLSPRNTSFGYRSPRSWSPRSYSPKRSQRSRSPRRLSPREWSPRRSLYRNRSPRRSRTRSRSPDQKPGGHHRSHQSKRSFSPHRDHSGYYGHKYFEDSNSYNSSYKENFNSGHAEYSGENYDWYINDPMYINASPRSRFSPEDMYKYSQDSLWLKNSEFSPNINVSPKSNENEKWNVLSSWDGDRKCNVAKIHSEYTDINKSIEASSVELSNKKELSIESSDSSQDSSVGMSLAERLHVEHGLDIDEEDPKKLSTISSSTNTQVFPPGKPKIRRVGNIIEVVPTDWPPSSPSPPPQTSSSTAYSGEPNIFQAPPKPLFTVPPPNICPTSVISHNMQSSTEHNATLPLYTSTCADAPIVRKTEQNILPIPVPTPVPPPKVSPKQASLNEEVNKELAKCPVLVSPDISVDFKKIDQSTLDAAAAAAAAAGVSLPVAHILSILQQQQELLSKTQKTTEETFEDLEKREAEKARLKKERKDKRRIEREKRRSVRRERNLREKKRMEKILDNNLSDSEEDKAIIQEAISETPVLGSPVPEYDISDDEDDEFIGQKKSLLPVALPVAEKGILMSPSYRYKDDYKQKSVKFADGVLPGEGTSPSGGEEIHSPPPPPSQKSKSKEKRCRKNRKRIKVKLIKQYKDDVDDDDSPPPPPPSHSPPATAFKLFPGCTRYTYTAEGNAIFYAQQENTLISDSLLSGNILLPGTNLGSGQPMSPCSLIPQSTAGYGYFSDMACVPHPGLPSLVESFSVRNAKE